MKTTGKLGIALLVIMGVSLLVYGTVATITKTYHAENKATTGEVAISLIQRGEGGEPLPEEQTVIPAQEITNQVTVQCESTVKSWVRVIIEKDGLDRLLGDDGLDVDETKWLKDDMSSEDYLIYYCREPLDPANAGEQGNSTTEVLLESLTINPALTGGEGSFTLTMRGQAVQYAHNGDGKGETVLNATGWPEIPETEEVA